MGGGGQKRREIVMESCWVDECYIGEHRRLTVNEIVGKYGGGNRV
jgi:hypothetical protein